jgi:hypothetical protein
MVLVLGVYSALADAGPVTSVAGAVVGSGEPDDGVVLDDVDDDDDDVDVDDDADDGDDDGDDAQDDGGDGAEGDDDDGDYGLGAQAVAQAIAGEFGATREDVLALHEEGIGFGEIFKLYALAAAMDTSVDELLATIPTGGDGEYDFGFGKLRKALNEEQQAALESGPKNLGQLVSASHRPEHAGPDSDEATAAGLEEAREKFAAHASNGHGPPESVPAHGRR